LWHIGDGEKIVASPKIHRRVCKDCHIHHVQTPEVGNDWAETVNGFVLMSFCPKCGVMAPPLNVADDIEDPFEKISNNMKRMLAKRAAKIFGLDYWTTMEISRSLRDVDLKKEYVRVFAFSVNTAFGVDLSAEQIGSVL